MEEKKGLSRRSFLSSTAVGAVGLAAAGFTAGALINPREAHAAVLAFPQPTVLDADRIKELGFYWYKKGPGCGHGSARALIQGFAEACIKEGKDPEGWADLHRNLYAWCNSGGPGGYGALCGAIAGAVGVMNLVGRQNDVGRAVFDWYMKTPLPGTVVVASDFNGSAPFTFTDVNGTVRTVVNEGHGASGSGALGAGAVPAAYNANHAVVVDSPLCHVSVSKWMAAAGVQHGEIVGGVDIRSDRCAKVTAETASEAARLYNLFKAGTAVPGWAKPAAMAGCYDCHDTNGTTWSATQQIPPMSNRSTQTKMDCLPCHTEPKSGRK